MAAGLQLGGDGIERIQGRREEGMPTAGWQQGVDVAFDPHVGDRPECEACEWVGEELWDEGDRETSHDQGSDRQLVPGDRYEVWLKSGTPAGADDQSVGQRRGPVFVAEVREPY